MPEENEPNNGQEIAVINKGSESQALRQSSRGTKTPLYRKACQELGLNELASRGDTNLAILGQKDFEIGAFDINAGCLSWQRTEMFDDLKRLKKILEKETEAKAIIALIKARCVLQKQIADNVKAMSQLSVVRKSVEKPQQEAQGTWKPGQMVTPTPIQINVGGGANGGGKVEIKTVEAKEITQ